MISLLPGKQKNRDVLTELRDLRRENADLRDGRVCSICKTRTYQMKKQPHHGCVLGCPEVTFCVPTIPEREGFIRNRAVRSVDNQMLKTVATVLEMDHKYKGSEATRLTVLKRIKTPYIAFMDDDDELHDNHLFLLMDHLVRTAADIVYSCHIDCTTPKGNDCVDCCTSVILARTHMCNVDVARKVKLDERTWIKHQHEGQTGGKK